MSFKNKKDTEVILLWAKSKEDWSSLERLQGAIVWKGAHKLAQRWKVLFFVLFIFGCERVRALAQFGANFGAHTFLLKQYNVVDFLRRGIVQNGHARQIATVVAWAKVDFFYLFTFVFWIKVWTRKGPHLHVLQQSTKEPLRCHVV